jgi:hypothetical protein
MVSTRAGAKQAPPNTMFEILRRNFLYHLSVLAFEPQNRLTVIIGRGDIEQHLAYVIHSLMCIPSTMFSECLSTKTGREGCVSL